VPRLWFGRDDVWFEFHGSKVWLADQPGVEDKITNSAALKSLAKGTWGVRLSDAESRI